MNYIFKGNLCAYLCGDCSEPLSNIKIRLYKIARVEDAALLAVANAKETFHQVNGEGLKAKTKLLLAETTANANGDFTFNLSDHEGYNGEAFDVDFVCGTGWGKPHPPKKTEEFQFHITTLQPQWREKQTNEQIIKFAGWEFCLSAKWWCYILKLIDRWVICGNIRDCETGVAAAGVRVFAYDVDLIQDDPLGDAYTDAYGHFRIVYTAADFSKTLLTGWNVEWPAGPDLYFRIESASGLVLLQEDRQTGHRQDRTNVHNCFCVDFCVKYPGGEVLVPWFTHVGNYNISADMDADGLTINNRSFASGVGFGFFGAVKLVGYASKKVPTDLTRPLYYRFMFSLDGSTWNPVTGTQTYPYRLKVGVRQIIWNGTTAFQDIVIDPAQPASVPDSIPPDNFPMPIPDHVLHLDAAGWVRVDQRGLDSGFYGPLLWVNTNTIVPGGNATDAGDAPGMAPVNPKLGHKVFFAFQITDDPSNPASPHFREQAQEGIIHVNNWNEVSLLRLDELFAGGGTGCSPISTNANVRFTADHELMAEWKLGVSSAAVPSISVIAPGSSGSAPRGNHLHIDFATPGTVTPAFTPMNWPSCAYRLTLTTRRRLTDGEYNDPGRNNELLFCR